MDRWMPIIPKDWQAYTAFRDEVFFPLLEAERYVEMGEAAETYLVTEQDSAIRFRVISEIAVFLDVPGHKDVAFHWAERLCEEFNDSPFAWCRMGAWYRAPRRETPANNRVAFGHYETGLGHAPAADQWVRYVLFDMCRLLANMENWSGLEACMREINSDLAVERELDALFLEDDWLQGIPEGAIDVSLVAQYWRLVAAPPNRRGGHRDVQK